MHQRRDLIHIKTAELVPTLTSPAVLLLPIFMTFLVTNTISWPPQGTATLNGESAQRLLRGRPRGRLGRFGSGNGRLRGRPRRLGSTQGGGTTLYLNNSKTLQS